jgi:hypothetical protein
MAQVRFLDQVPVGVYQVNSEGGGGISIASASIDLGIATTLNFTGSGITSINNVDGIALINISGSVGPSGSIGPSGSAGPSGFEGNLAVWQYDTNTNMSDSGSGYFRLDTAWNSPSTSKLLIDDVSFSPAINLGSVLNGITLNSIVKFVSLTDPNTYKYLQITGIAPFQTGFEVYDVISLAASGSPSTNDQFGFSIPAPSAGAIEILDNNVGIVTAVTSINFSGSAFTVTDNGNNAVTVFSNLGDVFPYTGSAGISGSVLIDGILLVKLDDGNGDSNKFQINQEGVMVLGQLDTTPTPISGGMFFSSSNEYFLGFS